MTIFAHVPATVDKPQLEIMRDELEDVRGEIHSLIGQIESVREDLYEKRCEAAAALRTCCRLHSRALPLLLAAPLLLLPQAFTQISTRN